MPSLKLFGRHLHLSSDSLPLLGICLFLPAFAFLAAYIVLLSIHFEPPAPPQVGCSKSNARLREVVVWGTLSFALLHVLSATAIIVVGMRGAPFESSKRRLMRPVLYFNVAQWACFMGFAGFSFWAVYFVQDVCWPHQLRTLEEAALWTSFCVYLAIFLTFYFAHNALAKYNPQKRWQQRILKASRLMGCYDLLMQGSVGEEDSSEAPLQQLAASFARYFGLIDLEKLDIVTGLTLVEIMQTQQRKALIAERLRQAGIPVSHAWKQQKGPTLQLVAAQPPAGADESAFPDVPPGQAPVQQQCREMQQDTEQRDSGSREHSEQQQPNDSGADKRDSAPGQGEVRLDMDEGGFARWLRDTSEGRSLCLTPSRWGAELAPMLTPQQSAEVYTGCHNYVSREVLQEVARWARFAAAAYGAPAYTWTRPKTMYWLSREHFKARAELRHSTRPARAVLAAAKPPVQHKLRQSKVYLSHYVAAKKLAGLTDDDFVYMSFTNAALGATPYIITLHRASRTVVLSVRGSNSNEDLLTDLMDKPVDIASWLPDNFLQEFPECGRGVSAHMGLYSSAKAVLQDLNRHQILPILLTGAPLPSEERARQQAWHAPDEQQLRWQEERHSTHSRRGEQLSSHRRDGSMTSMSTKWRLPQQHSQHGAAGGPAGGSPTAAGFKGSNGSDSAEGGKANSKRSSRARQGNHRNTDQPDQEEQFCPGDYQQQLAERGLDCRGWNLVVTGHSLGAAVAALVGVHLRSWCPGVKVWSLGPPGGMVAPNLAHALEGFVTSVAVGKDTISRLGTLTFERLMDQMVIALARSRLHKLRVLRGMRSAKLRERPPEQLFHHIDRIPPEALSVVRQYYASKCQYAHLLMPMLLPGRTMLLRRLKCARESKRNRRTATMDKQRRQQLRRGYSYDAVWIESEQLLDEGILLSRHQASDHYTARLMQMMGELAGRTTSRNWQESQGE